MHCPADQRSFSGCDRRGVSHIANKCTCGSLAAGATLFTTIVGNALSRRYDLVSYTTFLTSQSVDLCLAFNDVCSKTLSHLLVPSANRQNIGCSRSIFNSSSGLSSSSSNYSSWQGICRAGRVDASAVVAGNLYNAIVGPVLSSLVTPQTAQTTLMFDACSSYQAICGYFLDRIACPINLQIIGSCGNVTAGNPFGQPQSYVGQCQCGPAMTFMSTQVLNSLVTGVTAAQVATDYLVIPSNDPFILTVSSNPFRQLLYGQSSTPR